MKMGYKEKNRSIIKTVATIVSNTTSDGCFSELGVKQGTASVLIAKTLNRSGYLFDTWTTFPSYSKKDLGINSSVNSDCRVRKWSEDKIKRRIKEKVDTYDDCANALKKHGVENLCTMIKGDIARTVPDFFAQNPDLKFSMVHIDCNVYEPTKIGLEYFWPRMVDGGYILVQDAGNKSFKNTAKSFGAVWVGVKTAVNEFVQGRDDLSVTDKFNFSACCIVKKMQYDFSVLFSSLEKSLRL